MTESGRDDRRDRAPGVTKVEPREILQSLDAQVPGPQKAGGEPLSPIQWIGLALAGGVFAYIVIASIAIFLVSFRSLTLPAPPSPPTNAADVEHYKQLVDEYKVASDVYQQMAKLQLDRALQLFQLIVASTILPAFTGILGYIFGSRRSP
jgi:hypothetical protein